MNTHDMIELPQGYAERPFDYSGDLYTEGQVRAIIAQARADLIAEIHERVTDRAVAVETLVQRPVVRLTHGRKRK
ncbi:MAG: hypothetical protein RBU21_02920 [FCB group bacterium]|jgi:hypothetical protein|nr:hypothetical protein [FCB group bacterium]